MNIQKKILKIAKKILADYDYIYDPNHEKNLGGEYKRTEKGWSKDSGEKKTEKHSVRIYDEEYDRYFTLEEMRKEYEELKKSGETEAESFNDYIENITGKNGTCKIVNK